MKDISKLDKCPICNKKWKYKVKGKTYSKLIGIIISQEFDEVTKFMCPFCETKWNRATGEIIK